MELKVYTIFVLMNSATKTLNPKHSESQVPRPHPAMQGLVRGSGKRSGGGTLALVGFRA